MSHLEPYTVSHNATLLDAVEKIAGNKTRCVVVLDGAKVVGVLSEGDVIRALLRGTDTHTVLSQVIKPSFVYMNDRDRARAFELFRRFLFTLIPVVDRSFRLCDVI